MLDDPDDAAIVNSVLALALNFNRATLAEGIETEDHGVALIEFGCQLGQGYAIARPMPGTDVLTWLSQWQAPASWANSNPVTAVDVGALLAEVEHRAWLKQLHDFAHHKVPLDITMQPHNCHFGQWLNKRATRKRYGELPDMATLELIHQTVHQQADRLVRRLYEQPQWDASNELKLLDKLSAEMLLKLRQLRQTEPEAGWTDSMASQL
jgi:EAL domain-containing protein (putative c-di-GMP-specific phosphodiesterase class I)